MGAPTLTQAAYARNADWDYRGPPVTAVTFSFARHRHKGYLGATRVGRPEEGM